MYGKLWEIQETANRGSIVTVVDIHSSYGYSLFLLFFRNLLS